MNSRARLLQLLASLMLLLALAFPLWTISLAAPQYPEGIGLKIWAWQITGQKPQDLHNINGLNHYIGMQRIEPDSIPELKILPVAIVGFTLLGLLVAYLGRRWLLGAWLALLLAGCLAGLVDFYRWEYDYGHNLDPHAAIQVPGMSYQPPLLGTRQLLNMRTTSLPGAGGVAVLLSVLLAGAVLWSTRPHSGRGSRGGAAGNAVAVLLATGLLPGCSGGPRPIDYGQDACARCRMFVMDARYGSELVTLRGKVLVFDSAECLAAWVVLNPLEAQEARATLVTHYRRPEELVPAETTVFLQSADLPSPMGLGLSGCADHGEARALQQEFGGELLDWPQLQGLVRTSWKLP
ncbi:MAG: nitrous oxide reductase accessory protein NosL [Candidatus Cloacimonetes bacterium]|nr:nitrous oxide reductase accessory protein NosL [Candidatus Cloacimonadota bacterium]